MSLPRNVPTATVNLDRPRTIAFTLDALLRLQETTGQSLTQLSGDLSEIMGSIDKWIWSGLIDGDREDITPAEVRNMIHLGNLGGITEAVTSLVSASMPEPKGAEGNALPVPQRVRKAASRI